VTVNLCLPPLAPSLYQPRRVSGVIEAPLPRRVSHPLPLRRHPVARPCACRNAKSPGVCRGSLLSHRTIPAVRRLCRPAHKRRQRHRGRSCVTDDFPERFDLCRFRCQAAVVFQKHIRAADVPELLANVIHVAALGIHHRRGRVPQHVVRPVSSRKASFGRMPAKAMTASAATASGATVSAVCIN